jgi:hypothetical protein
VRNFKSERMILETFIYSVSNIYEISYISLIKNKEYNVIYIYIYIYIFYFSIFLYLFEHPLSRLSR